MKTIKFIIAALLVAVTVYSCSSDREEETVQQSSTSKLDIKKLKTSNNHSATAKTGDTIIAPPKSMPETTAGEEIAPIDGGDPKDLPPRK